MDDRPSFFGDRNRETASCRAILVSVDNCENVDKMWVGVTRESAGKALPKAYNSSRGGWKAGALFGLLFWLFRESGALATFRCEMGCA